MADRVLTPLARFVGQDRLAMVPTSNYLLVRTKNTWRVDKSAIRLCWFLYAGTVLPLDFGRVRFNWGTIYV